MMTDKIMGGNVISCERCKKTFDARSSDIYACRSSSIPVEPVTVNFLKNTSWEYLCSNCLRELDVAIASLGESTFPRPSELEKDIHYYIENEFCVFTERYHLLRGSCCKNGCRHCPYGFKKQK